LPPWRADHSGEARTDQRPSTAPPACSTGPSSDASGRYDGDPLQHFCHSGCKNLSILVFRIDMGKICPQALLAS
jgi:hypothetical protein